MPTDSTTPPMDAEDWKSFGIRYSPPGPLWCPPPQPAAPKKTLLRIVLFIGSKRVSFTSDMSPFMQATDLREQVDTLAGLLCIEARDHSVVQLHGLLDPNPDCHVFVHLAGPGGAVYLRTLTELEGDAALWERVLNSEFPLRKVSGLVDTHSSSVTGLGIDGDGRRREATRPSPSRDICDYKGLKVDYVTFRPKLNPGQHTCWEPVVWDGTASRVRSEVPQSPGGTEHPEQQGPVPPESSSYNILRLVTESLGSLANRIMGE